MIKDKDLFFVQDMLMNWELTDWESTKITCQWMPIQKRSYNKIIIKINKGFIQGGLTPIEIIKWNN